MTPMGRVTMRLSELDLVLPTRVPPAPDHAVAVQSGSLLFLSGHGPLDEDRRPVYKGRVGAELTEEDGYVAARRCALNVLATLEAELDDLDRVRRVIRLTGYVSSPPDFERHPWVINGASQLFTDVFLDRGRHARTTMGVAGLPLGMPCAIDCVFEVD